MLIKNEFQVAAPVDKVWQFFGDIPQVAACLPGTELTNDLGDDKYEGQVAVRMGPVRLQFAGKADITERDEAAKRVVVNATGAEEKGRGQASMVVTATLAAAGRGTKVSVAQDLQLSGAAAQYGRGMISDVSAVLMRDFSVNLADRIDRAERGEAVTGPATAASPASGVTLGIRAALMALRRVFRRFFVPYQATSGGERAMVLWWIGNAILLLVVLPVVIFLLNRVLAALERVRAATDDILAGGVELVGELSGVPDGLAITDSTVKQVSVGAVRYAGSVAKLLG